MQESETVRITLAAEQGEARAASDIELKRYVVEAYTTDGQPANIFAGNTTHHLQQSVPTFTLRLDRTKQYSLLFWADCEEETTAAYNVANLKQVAVIDGKKANANAFCAQLAIMEVKDSYTVTLRRAVSRVVLWEKNHIKSGASLKASYPAIAGFDVETGTVETGEGQTEESFTLTEATNGTNAPETGVQVGEFYLFANTAESELGNITFTLTEGDRISNRTVSNVPLQANYVTHIRGEFSQYTDKSFSVSIDSNWEDNGTVDAVPDYTLSVPNDKSSDWTVYTAKGLRDWMDYLKSAHSAVTSNIRLAADIDLQNEEWDSDLNVYAWSGTFDGGGHTIKGLYMNDVYTNGLINYAKDATIKNVVLESPVNKHGEAILVGDARNCTLTGCVIKQCELAEPSNNCGALAGTAYDCRIEDCHAIGGKITRSSRQTTQCYIGGLVGSMGAGSSEGEYHESRMYRCSSSVEIDDQTTLNGVLYAGGLVGNLVSNNIPLHPKNVSVDVIACCATGNVNSSYTSGGLIGQADADCRIVGCYATGTVASKSLYGALIGSSRTDGEAPGTEHHVIGCYSYSLGSEMADMNFLSGSFSKADVSYCASSSKKSRGTLVGCQFPANAEAIYPVLVKTEAQQAWDDAVNGKERFFSYVTSADGQKYNLSGVGEGIAGSIWKEVPGGTPKLFWEE